MYFNWKIHGLMIWLPYIDECVCFANAEDVKDSHKKTKTNFLMQ